MKKIILSALLASTALVACTTTAVEASENRAELGSRKHSNSSFTDEKHLTPIEKPISDLVRANQLIGSHEGAFEEISTNGTTYRLSYVMGDNDCGLHSLNAEFPGLNLTRDRVLKDYNDILNNQQHEAHKIVKRELANVLVAEMRQLAAMAGRQFLPQGDPFIKAVTGQGLDEEARMAALFSDARPLVNQAEKNPVILRAYIEYLKNPNNQLLSLSEDNEFLGSFGLVCNIYKLDVLLINFAKSGDMPTRKFQFGKVPGLKPILFRAGHFSPLCDMRDIEERNRLSAHHINTLILPKLNRYRNIILSPKEQIHLQKIAAPAAASNQLGASLPSISNNNNVPKPAKLLGAEDFGDKHTIEDQMARALAESAALAGKNQPASIVPKAASQHFKASPTAAADAKGLPHDFDPITYVLKYEDLQSYAFDEKNGVVDLDGWARWHFLHNGINEGRSYK